MAGQCWVGALGSSQLELSKEEDVQVGCPQAEAHHARECDLHTCETVLEREVFLVEIQLSPETSKMCRPCTSRVRLVVPCSHMSDQAAPGPAAAAMKGHNAERTCIAHSQSGVGDQAGKWVPTAFVAGWWSLTGFKRTMTASMGP